MNVHECENHLKVQVIENSIDKQEKQQITLVPYTFRSALPYGPFNI